MELFLEKISQEIDKINVLINNSSFLEANEYYLCIEKELEIHNNFITGIEIKDRERISEFYSSYAYFLFEMGEYELFFSKFITAQEYGYSAKKRREFIYKAFIEPNISEFEYNYRTSLANLNIINTHKNLGFEELSYWLLTNGVDDEYYLYNKQEDIIEEKVQLNTKTHYLPKIEEPEIILVKPKNWMEINDHLCSIDEYENLIYIIDNNTNKLLSYLQGAVYSETIISRIIFFENWDSFRNYFFSTNNYFPRHIRGKKEDLEVYEALKSEIHQHRIKKENRSGENILLSICIPSYNRGMRAYENVIHTLKTNFDEEIEIVLSNNGTKNETKEFYEKIEKIEDGRVTYFEFDENKGAALNVCKTAELAKGEFILLLSDEDLIDLEQLLFLMNTLKVQKNEVGVVRVKSNKQGTLPFIGIGYPGMDALSKFMLTSNYLSGNIYNKSSLVKYSLIEKIKKNLDNETCLYYPHMVWELELCQYKKVIGMDIILINEGKAEISENAFAQIGKENQKNIPYFATYKGRLAQHNGFYEIMKNMEVCSDFDTFRILYRRLCGKTLFLISLSIRVYYEDTDINTNDLMDQTYQECIKYLNEIYYGRKSSNKHKFKEDQDLIKHNYLQIKNQISR